MNFKKLILSLTVIFTMIFAAAGCTLSSVRTIRVVSGIPSTLELDQEVDLHGIVIEVTVDGTVNQTVYGDSEGVSIKGLDTSSAGQKTAVVSYKGVSVSVSYLVVGGGSLVRSMPELITFMTDSTETILTLGPGTYDLTGGLQNIVIGRSLVIRASQPDTVILKDVVVDFAKNTTPSIVEFRNVNITNDIGQTPLTIKSNRGLTDTTTYGNIDKVVLNNVTLTGKGEVSKGIDVSGLTNFEMYNSKVKTLTQDDYFQNMINFNTKKNFVMNILENNEFKCNFWYAFKNVSQLIARGNLFEGTIPVDTHLKDSAYAPIYNVGKQPVLFHVSLPTSGDNKGQMRLIIENNTIKNVENVLRIYQTDNNTTISVEDDIVFNNNLVTGVNYLVNHSSNSYSTDVLPIVLAGLRSGSTYQNQKKGVLSKNTEISGNLGSASMKVVTFETADYRFYEGLEYQEKGTTDEENRYDVVAISVSGSKPYLSKSIDGVIHYYLLGNEYSADGLDTRTLTPVTDVSLINFFNNNRY